MGFSRPECWSRQPFPSSGDLPNPGIESRSPTLQVDSLPAEPQGKPKNTGVGQPIPSPGDLPDPGIKLGSPALQADSLPAELQWCIYVNPNLPFQSPTSPLVSIGLFPASVFAFYKDTCPWIQGPHSIQDHFILGFERTLFPNKVTLTHTSSQDLDIIFVWGSTKKYCTFFLDFLCIYLLILHNLMPVSPCGPKLSCRRELTPNLSLDSEASGESFKSQCVQQKWRCLAQIFTFLFTLELKNLMAQATSHISETSISWGQGLLIHIKKAQAQEIQPTFHNI